MIPSHQLYYSMKLIGHILAVFLLTLLTQIGGVIYVVAWMLKKITPRRRWRYGWFPLLYLVIWLLLPLLARPFGRVPLPYRSTTERPLQAHHFFTVMANRHYVRPELRDETIRIARALAQAEPGLTLTYLDANFPFWDGFPLLPHRSHDDGGKLDLAFAYRKAGSLTTRAPAFLGYGRCAGPKPTEIDQPKVCARKGYWQYSVLQFLAMPFTGERYTLDERESARIVRAFARSPVIGKLFIEPHLKTRWGLTNYQKIRYHGCPAVRHDDHLHIQL